MRNLRSKTRNATLAFAPPTYSLGVAMNAAMSISPQVMLFQPVWTWRMRLPYPPFLPNLPLLPMCPHHLIRIHSHPDPQLSLFSSSYGFLSRHRLSPIFLPSSFPGSSVNATRREHICGPNLLALNAQHRCQLCHQSHLHPDELERKS